MDDSWATQITSSSSSSCFPPQPKYDVFLSFSGVDTRKNFTDHLLAALERRGIYTFRDDTKLNRGEDIKHELPKAIEESRVSIVVFSKNYAASTWCLDELVKIMECKKSFQQIVLPIFYDVKPSEVRRQMGRVAEAIAEYKKCEKVEEWRRTLTEIADLSGRVLENEASGHEAKFIQTIVEDVEKKLKFVPLYVADHPVGMEPRLQCMTELLRMESNDARIVAIWRIGGIGKTTIAKAVYNHFHRQFEGWSFIADIRETSKNGLVLLQKHLLSDILGNEYLNIGNVHQGVEVLKSRVFCRRLLLVLDDVDHVDQLKALAMDQNFLYPGSRIIITTRDISSLNSLKLVDGKYEPKGLNQYESLQLFCRHAFKENNPMVDYIELSDEVVHYSRGVPLALEVLGSYLFNKTKSEWRSAITKLKKIPHDDVQKKLRISFDSLSEESKELFLDIACFFVGMDQDFTIKILEGCDFHPVIGIRELTDRCLINSHNFMNNRIVMHDVLRDMGKEIVRQESIKQPGRRSRLWDSEDSLQVLRGGTGTEMVEGLFLNLFELEHVRVNAKDEDFFHNLPEAKVVEATFEKMKRLRLLHLNFVRLNVSSEHISRRLVWLSWKGFPLNCVPSNLSLENLVSLDLSYSKLKKVWKERKGLSLRNPITLIFGGVIPTWTEYQSVGSCLPLVVPPLVNQKLLGLFLYGVFRYPEYYDVAVGYRIINKSNGFERLYQQKYLYRYRDVETWFGYVPLYYTEMQIGEQDGVEISIIKSERYQVENWGVTPVYEVDKNNTEANDGALIKYTSSLTYEHLAEGIGPSSDQNKSMMFLGPG